MIYIRYVESYFLRHALVVFLLVEMLVIIMLVSCLYVNAVLSCLDVLSKLLLIQLDYILLLPFPTAHAYVNEGKHAQKYYYYDSDFDSEGRANLKLTH